MGCDSFPMLDAVSRDEKLPVEVLKISSKAPESDVVDYAAGFHQAWRSRRDPYRHFLRAFGRPFLTLGRYRSGLSGQGPPGKRRRFPSREFDRASCDADARGSGHFSRVGS